MSVLTLAQASVIVDAAMKKGRESNLAPLAVAVLDSGGRIVTNPGGVLIRDSAGNLVGACGISGDTSDKDEMCAVAGIEAAGLKAEPGVD
jgi:uncharacterized protein GlcG (DUF336 family)